VCSPDRRRPLHTRDIQTSGVRAAFELFILISDLSQYITASGSEQEDRASSKGARQCSCDGSVRISEFRFMRDSLTLENLIAGVAQAQYCARPPLSHSRFRNSRYDAGEVHRRYRALSVIAFCLNEVGGDPAAAVVSVARVNESMQERAAKWAAWPDRDCNERYKAARGDARGKIIALPSLPMRGREGASNGRRSMPSWCL